MFSSLPPPPPAVELSTQKRLGCTWRHVSVKYCLSYRGRKREFQFDGGLKGVTRPRPCTCLLLAVCVIITLRVRGWLNRASSPSSGSWSQHSRWHGYAQSDCNRLSSWKWKTAEAHSHYFLNTKQSTFFTRPSSVNCWRKSLRLSEIVLGFCFFRLYGFYVVFHTHTQCTYSCLIKRPSFQIF